MDGRKEDRKREDGKQEDGKRGRMEGERYGRRENGKIEIWKDKKDIKRRGKKKERGKNRRT